MMTWLSINKLQILDLWQNLYDITKDKVEGTSLFRRDTIRVPLFYHCGTIPRFIP